MAKQLSDETLKMNIVLNGNKAQAALSELQKTQVSLKKSNQDLNKEKQKLIRQGKKESQAYKNITSEITKNNKALKINRESQTKLRKEIGITSLTTRQLSQETRRLKSLMGSFSPDTDEWKAYNKELARVTTRQQEIREKIRNTSNSLGKQKKSVFSNTKNWLAMATGIGAAVEIGRQAITFTKDFIKEGIKMADQARGVEMAFNAIGESGKVAFKEVREAVRGTLSDLDIRKALVNFYNFRIPQESAATFFEFLTLRSTQTGEDITKLQSSLVEGLSKQSKLRIDNLGISSTELNEELKKTPDFIQAVANIAQREVAKAGDIIDKAASNTARWNASTDNLQLSLGKLIGNAGKGNSVISVFSGIIDGLATGVDLLSIGFDFLAIGVSNFIDPFLSSNKEVENSSKNFSDLWEVIGSSTLTAITSSFIFLGSILSGLGSVISLTQKRFHSFFKSLMVFSEIGFDPLNPLQTFKNLKEFDFKNAFSGIKNSFSEGGKTMAEAFKEGFKSVEIQVASNNKKNNNTPVINNKTTQETSLNKSDADKEAETLEKKRLDALSSLQEQYLKEREERLATSHQARAELEAKRAIDEAIALQAKQETLDLIKQEHQIKINEAIAIDQQKEIDGLKNFEDRKRAVLNEIELQNAASDEEREILKEQQRLENEQIKLERELDSLQLSANQKLELEKLLAETSGNVVAGIQKKFRDKEKQEAEKLAEEKKRILNDSLDTFIDIAGSESKVGKALILAKRLLAVKELAIDIAKFKAKTTLNAAEAGSDIAKGTAKSASASPFPTNLALIAGFLASVAGLVSTITSLGKTNVKTQGFEDGLYPDKNGRIDVTRTDGKRFNARFAGPTKTGIVSKPTVFRDKLVSERKPELIVDGDTLQRLDPTVVKHIYNVRDRRIRGYEDGLFPALSGAKDTPLPLVNEEQKEMNMMLMGMITRLNERLDQPLTAITRIGYDEDEELEQMRDERKESNKIGTIAE